VDPLELSSSRGADGWRLRWESKVNSFVIEIFISINRISRLFTGLALIISFIVVLYRISYMIDDKFINRFLFFTFTFVVSMLSITPRL